MKKRFRCHHYRDNTGMEKEIVASSWGPGGMSWGCGWEGYWPTKKNTAKQDRNEFSGGATTEAGGKTVDRK